MAHLIADAQGKAWVHLATDDPDERISFALSGDQGVPFAPGQAVEIDDARLEAVIATITAGLPVGGVRRIETDGH